MCLHNAHYNYFWYFSSKLVDDEVCISIIEPILTFFLVNKNKISNFLLFCSAIYELLLRTFVRPMCKMNILYNVGLFAA